MFEEFVAVPAPAPEEQVEIIMTPSFQADLAAAAPSPPTPEQAAAVEAVFADEQTESDQVAGLIGMWVGTLMLRDLAVETFREPVEEGKPAKEKRKRLPSEPEA